MKTWVITGGAASGKSAFARLLHELEPSSELFSSDEAVHQLLMEPPVVEAIVASFGKDILDEKGAILRGKLREKVFAASSTQPKAELEAILHPLVRTHLEEMRSRLENGKKTELLIAEIPLFYESSHDYQADLVIVVAVGTTVQLERLTGLRGLDPATAERLCAAQWPLSRKLEAAHQVIWNEGTPELLKLQAQLLLQQLNADNGK